MMKPIIVVHYGEIALKGKNRRNFETRLRDNVARSVTSLCSSASIKKADGRLLISFEDRAGDEFHQLKHSLIDRLKELPGITHFGIGYEVKKDIHSIQECVIEIAKDLPSGSFKIDTRRSDKQFSLTSPEVNAIIGEAVVERFRIPVRLNRPDNVIRIEITYRGVYVYGERCKGVGGLPVDISGNVISLISAGFDSPVASYLMMKRGARVYFVHFHSYPYVSKNSIDLVHKLVRRLSDFQHESVCYFVPLAEIQKKIMVAANSKYRVLLYRRAMVRLAETIGRSHRCEALVSGESLGQVASQTLRNIRVIDHAASLPILRPVIGMDKNEIIELSRNIGTYEISSQPYDDCCSFLMPRQPETWANLEAVQTIEAALDIEEEYTSAIERSEKTIFTSNRVQRMRVV